MRQKGDKICSNYFKLTETNKDKLLKVTYTSQTF